MLRIKDLTVYYGRARALDRISLQIEKGGFTTIIGANGAGKTTLLRSISALKSVESGEIWFDSTRLDRLFPDDIVRLGIGHVPEGRQLFPDMTVLENLLVGAYLRKEKGKMEGTFEQVFHYFNILKERKNQRAGSLSGGEQQMLAIGRALMGEPLVLMLDEPTFGLAPLIVKEVGHIITNIYRTGKAILLVEQNARLALNLANYGYILAVGKVMMEGEVVKLREQKEVKKAYLGG